MAKANKALLTLNSIVKECDEIYRIAAKNLGLSDCAFWILYILRTEGELLTQHEICDEICMPKQTVNSALKKLEQEGCIALLSNDDRRSKRVKLTEKGVSLVRETIDRVVIQENAALAGLSTDEQEAFLQLYRKYTDLLSVNMKVLGDKSDR